MNLKAIEAETRIINASKTTPGIIIPIKAKDSINEAPIIPRPIH